MRDLRVEVLRVARAPRELRARGMIAWLRVGVHGLVVDGVSLARDATSAATRHERCGTGVAQ